MLDLSCALEKANHHEKDMKAGIADNRKRLYLDISIKMAALLLTFFIYPPTMMISVLVTMILMIYWRSKKLTAQYHVMHTAA